MRSGRTPQVHHRLSLNKDSKMIEENAAFKVVNGAFPHIGKAIQVFWGHREFHEYMDNLQQERKGVVRAGFPNNVMNALLELTAEHDASFPELKPKMKDVWSIYADRR